MFLFWLLNDVLIDSEWKRFPAKELLPQLKPIYEVRRKTLCCDVELITRQTLTEFSRIREVTSRNRQRAHHSKATKSIHFPTLSVNVLFYSCLLSFKVYLVHHLFKISIHFIFCQVPWWDWLHADTCPENAHSNECTQYCDGERTSGGGVTDGLK